MQKAVQNDEESFKLQTTQLMVKHSRVQCCWNAKGQDDGNKGDLKNYTIGQKEILRHIWSRKQALESGGTSE